MTRHPTHFHERAPKVLIDLALTLWVGGMWCTGYIVAPMLFATLPDRALAGSVAGSLFKTMGWIGLAAGVLVLALLRFNCGRDSWQRVDSRLVLVLMLLTATGLFVVHPQIAALRTALATGSVDAAATFKLWHGVSAILYLVTSLLGGALLGWRGWNPNR